MPDASLRLALERYGLDRAKVSRLPGGMINANFRVDHAGRALVLKRYAPGMREFEPDRLSFSLQTQEMVRSKGAPAAAVVRNLEGGLYTSIGASNFSVCEFVEGIQYPRGKMPPECARSMGSALHSVFQALADLPPVAPRPLPEKTAAVERIEGLLALVHQRDTQDPIDRIAAGLLESRLRGLAAWDGPAPATAPHWSHGDYQDSNVIFSDTGAVAGIIDWDVVARTSRPYEVMRAFAFSFPPGAPEGFDFLRAYIGAAKPSPEEAAAFVDLWDYVTLTRLWPIDVRYEAPDLYQERWDEFIHPPTGWWDANRGLVREILFRAAAEASGS